MYSTDLVSNELQTESSTNKKKYFFYADAIFLTNKSAPIYKNEKMDAAEKLYFC